MLDKTKVKQLLLDLIAFHNHMIENGEFKHSMMPSISKNSFGHVILCAEDAGYITEEEVDLLEDMLKE